MLANYGDSPKNDQWTTYPTGYWISNNPECLNGLYVNDHYAKANRFLDQFCPLDSTLDVGPHDLNEEMADAVNTQGFHPLNSLFTKSKLVNCLKNLRSKATGLDRIHNEMITHLSDSNLDALIYLINVLFQSNYVPENWKSSITAPILKPIQPSSLVNSYLPTALTSCLEKIAERMIDNRLNGAWKNSTYYPIFKRDSRKDSLPLTILFALSPPSNSVSTPRKLLWLLSSTYQKPTTRPGSKQSCSEWPKWKSVAKCSSGSKASSQIGPWEFVLVIPSHQ